MGHPEDERIALSRRAVLYGGGLLGAGALLGWTAPARAEDAAPATPADALQRLQAGQARFAAGQTTEPRRDLARLREVAPKQTPFAAVLACADSRVPPEILYDQGFGDLFVVRVAGNIVSSAEIASLEYSVYALGAKAVIVLGHSDCGAVKAALAGGEVPGQISTLYHLIAPALERKHMDLAQATVANVRYQARKLKKGSTVLGQRLRAEQIALVGGVFDFQTGAVTAVDL